MADDYFPGESPPAPIVRRWPRRLGLVVLGVLALLGPWPVDNGSYPGTRYQARTLNRLDSMPRPTPPGPIRVGMAEVDLTPSYPVPLAGFSNQAGKLHAGVDTPCSARALTVAAGSRLVTILTADLLLINDEMARAVLDRDGLKADEVFFTASHTHGGPGGWGRHPIEQLVAGTFDPGVFAMLADRLGDVVRRSRADLVPAEMAMVQAHPSGRQKNRVVPGDPTHDALSALVFRPAGADTKAAPLAILAVFGAHATIVRTDPPRMSADYPGALVADLKARTGAGMVLFASGAVGDAAPVRPPIPGPTKAARALGSMLADDLLAVLPSARFSPEDVVDRLRLAVDLPPMRLPFFSAWLRFSPAATWWIADQTTHLDALRIGPAVLVGFPGDESGHLAERLVAEGRSSGLTPVVTSFNGDYRGYFTSGAIFLDHPHYETRWMNFYGPWAGEYLGDVAARMIDHLTGVDDSTLRPIHGRSGDRLSRLPVVILLVTIVVLVPLRGRFGSLPSGLIEWLATIVGLGFAIAFVVDPHGLGWARFGLTDWIRLMGWAIGGFALLRSPRSTASVRVYNGLAWASLALLTTYWPIVLAGILALPRARPAKAPAWADHQSK